MKKTILSYLKFAGAGLIASAADNLTYFILNHLGIADSWALIAARIVSLIVNYFLLKTAVFRKEKRADSFPRYILLVIFSTTVIYFLMQWLEPLLPGIDPVFIKMALEFIMNFFNYAVTRFFVFDNKKGESPHEA
ncbi:MAG: GtrA family protein [Anaerolineaceae bacterium]|nr:GtrA family protein [Anaerolineaceae bacterium]